MAITCDVQRVLLVGELNKYNKGPRYDLFPLPPHCAGGRLAKILGLTTKQYLETFDRVNLCRKIWSNAEARQAAEDILRNRRGPIVLLGKKVARAFGMGSAEFFQSYGRARGSRICVIPHPSGLCRIWNDPENVRRARELVLKTVYDNVGEVLCQRASR